MARRIVTSTLDWMLTRMHDLGWFICFQVTNRDDSEEAKVKALSSVADEGEQVWVKVVSVQVEEDGKTKIGCSMKYVNQGNGEDLDPNNIQAEKNQARPSWKEPQKVSAFLA